MTENWTDVTDGNTKWFKRLAITKFIIKMGIMVFFVVEVVAIAKVVTMIAPYVNDAELVMEHVWTNSQITAAIELAVLVGALWIFSKMVTSIMRK